MPTMAPNRNRSERGGCLSAFLVFVMLAEGLRLVAGGFMACSPSGSSAEQTKGAIIAGAGAVGWPDESERTSAMWQVRARE
jgi:hypothetical protein